MHWNRGFLGWSGIACPCLLVAALAAARVQAAPAVQPGTSDLTAFTPALAALAPDTLVVFGRGAPQPEQQAAEKIAAEFRKCGGPANNLIDDVTGLHDLDLLIHHDLVLVGTYDDNDVLHEEWGHWAVDYSQYSKQPATPDLKPKGPLFPGAPSAGFAVMGYGTFKSPDTGYIETDRNAFYLVPQMLHVNAGDPYRIRVNITGASTSGVVRAAQAFLDTGCLCGVIPAANEAIPAGDALRIGRDQLTTAFPSWLPRQHLLGWIMADSTLYAGFLEASSMPASIIWIAKYNESGAIKGFVDTPHRMSTSDELFVAKTASAADAQAALNGLVKTLGATKVVCSPAIIGAHSVFRSGDFIAGTAGPWVILCTVTDPTGSELVSSVLDHAP